MCFLELRDQGAQASTSIMTDPIKIEAITQWLKPYTSKEMQSFLGGVNWNRQFSLTFVKLTAPLDEVRNSKSINWTPEREQALDDIKKLCSNLMLHYIDLKHRCKSVFYWCLAWSRV